MKKYIYMCDGGSLMLGNDNLKVHFSNGYGDGEFDIIIGELGENLDTRYYIFKGSVDGTFNVYGYDCDDREVLATITGRYGVYACDGDMILECWNE